MEKDVLLCAAIPDASARPDQRDTRKIPVPDPVIVSAISAAAEAYGAGNSVDLDPFDPRNHRKPQDPRLLPGGIQSYSGLPSSIEARKPSKTWFIRIHPDPDYRAEVPLYIDEDSKRRNANTYLFAPGLEIPSDLDGLVRDTLVAAAITSSGIHFLYILPVGDHCWYESGVEVFRRATTEWVRVVPADGSYQMISPIAKLDEPHFPDVPFRMYLERAFGKRLITSVDDPIVKKLRGAR